MGLRGKAPKPKGETLRFKAGVNPPPSHLDAEAKKVYARLSQLLELVLQEPDEYILAIFAQATADVARLTVEIRKEGEVVEGRQAGMVTNPKIRALDAARKTVINAGAKLGFSPADRARVPAAAKGGSLTNEFADI
jgi:P27 family predicted phage terminase small subunit